VLFFFSRAAATEMLRRIESGCAIRGKGGGGGGGGGGGSVWGPGVLGDGGGGGQEINFPSSRLWHVKSLIRDKEEVSGGEGGTGGWGGEGEGERAQCATARESEREQGGGERERGSERYREMNKCHVTEGGGGLSARAVKQVEMRMRASGMSGNSKPLLLLTGSLLPLQ
jgi:hypothetical protein